jgi:endo-beta-N-acetylglucosaminidase D
VIDTLEQQNCFILEHNYHILVKAVVIRVRPVTDRRISFPCRYDSVTTKGTLEWQDGLTSLNEPFFAAADGLFVNYTWKKESPEECAREAGHRAADVFMGIDVFGRGSFGGGQYNVSRRSVESLFGLVGDSCKVVPG